MKSNIKNIVLLSVSLLLLPMYLFSQGQPFFSENWNNQGGETAMFYKNATVTDNQRNIYVAGATINGAGNHDILIQKLNPRGDLIWEATYNGYANMDDASADIFVDNQLNVYVTGTTIKNPTNAQDLIVLKYDKTGTLKWEYIYDNNGNAYGIDVGTAITGDNNGNLYVTGSSFGTNTQADYVTLRLNSDNGNKIWEQRYDYAGLNEIPAKIIVKGNDLYVSGASQVSSDKWELATLFYKASNGTLLGARRSVGNATHGVNEITDITLDNVGNIYLTGAVQNTNSYDIAVYKLDDELNILWEVHYDAYGDDDKGNGIKVDGQGNVYIAGTISTQNEGKNYVLLKYNSSGVLQWEREFNGRENGNDEAVQLTLHNDYIYITGLAKNSSRYSFQTLVYKPNGNLYTQAEYTNVNENEKPTGITTDLSGDIIIVGQTELSNGNYRTRTIKYSLYEKPFEPVFENGEPKYNANEVIIRFDRSAVNYSAIDRKGFIAGQLDDFVKPNIITELNNELEMNVARFPAYKIFKRMTTSDTLSVTRLGDTIKVDDFWATFSVMLPKHVDEEEIVYSLNGMDDLMIHYAHLNGIIERNNIPNDELISSEQAGLIPTATFPNAHINITNAWDIEVGQSYTKVGIFDDPIYWAHEDFGDGSWQGSKIEDGWDYYNEIHISDVQSPSSHGTSTAGIIGALRNNGTGIAGIAGGDVDGSSNTGVQLFSMGIFNGKKSSSIETAAAAIVEGALNTGTYGYGLDIQNHSWGGPQAFPIIEDAVKTSWRHHSIFIASRGNDGHLGNPLNYPACYDDKMVLNTGASGYDGEYKNMTNGDNWWASSYGGSVDFIAPGTTEIVTSLINPDSTYNFNCTSSLYPNYQCFNGTSAAAPHVTGVAALMYSKHNVNNGAPNNLATEDIENILQKNATDKGAIGYDDLNGWGLINAYASVEEINFPKYYVKHAPTVTPTQTTAPNLTVIIANNTDGIAAGTYKADRIQLNWTYIDILPTQHEIIDWWPLEARTYKGVGGNNPITGQRYMNVTPNVTIGGNAAVFSVQTFAWWIKTSVSSGQTINKWIPAGGPSSLKYSYSLHVKDNSVASIEDNENEIEVNLYPNPVTDIINLTLNLDKTSDVQFEILDLQGKIIANPKMDNNLGGEHTFSINVSNLSNGLYLLKATTGGRTLTKKFIKQ